MKCTGNQWQGSDMGQEQGGSPKEWSLRRMENWSLVMMTQITFEQQNTYLCMNSANAGADIGCGYYQIVLNNTSSFIEGNS